MAYIELKEVDKVYQMGETELKALDKATFEIEKGECEFFFVKNNTKIVIKTMY